MRDRVIIKTSIVGIISNIVLVIGKIVIGLLAKSISIITDAVNNLTDALSSIITIVGTKLSNKKPDREHPFGHGRVEFVASTLIGMLIFVAGFMAIYSSINSLINQEQSEYSLYSFIVVGIAVVGKVLLGLYFRKQGNRINSGALKASGIDALMDSLLSLGTLVGAFIAYFAGIYLEGYIGIVIGLFIIKAAIGVLKESISKIIGERTDEKTIQEMIKDISSLDEVYGVYDVIINNYGNDRNIGSLHVEVKDSITAKEIQALERQIAAICYEKYQTIMTVGVYAQNLDNEENKKVKESILNIIKKYPEVIQTHGFYIDNDKHIISLDIIIDFDCKEEGEIYKNIKEEISKMYPSYLIYLILDKDFSVVKEQRGIHLAFLMESGPQSFKNIQTYSKKERIVSLFIRNNMK